MTGGRSKAVVHKTMRRDSPVRIEPYSSKQVPENACLPKQVASTAEGWNNRGDAEAKPPSLTELVRVDDRPGDLCVDLERCATEFEDSPDPEANGQRNLVAAAGLSVHNDVLVGPHLPTTRKQPRQAILGIHQTHIFAVIVSGKRPLLLGENPANPFVSILDSTAGRPGRPLLGARSVRRRAGEHPSHTRTDDETKALGGRYDVGQHDVSEICIVVDSTLIIGYYIAQGLGTSACPGNVIHPVISSWVWSVHRVLSGLFSCCRAA